MLCLAPFIAYGMNWGAEFDIGGGWRRDASSQQIFEASFSSSSPAYQQSVFLSPLWELRSDLALVLERFRVQGDVCYAPFSHGRESIHDFERSTAPEAQEASFHLRPSGYVLGAQGTLFYSFVPSRYFSILPLGGYVYNKLKMNRKHVTPIPFVLPSGADSSPTFAKERDEAFGPFLGMDFLVRWPQRLSLQAGYEYQFLSYQSRYHNHLHIVQNTVFDQRVVVSRSIKTSHAFAHQAHAQLTWEITRLFHLSLLGEATYRYVNKRDCSHTGIDIEATLPTVSTIALQMMDKCQIYWSTLSIDLLLSLLF